MMDRSWRLLTVVTTLVLLAACQTAKQKMVSEGYPKSYADGFEDGCRSGKKAGGSLFEQFHKDVNRFNSDQNYAQGWSDAYRQCENEEEALERRIRMSMELQRMDQSRIDRMAHDALKGIDTSGLKNLKTN